MADYPYMPVEVSDLLADTSHLSDEEFGAYCRMLFVSWNSPKCDLPNDINWIKKRFGITSKNLQLYEMLIETFFTKRGSRLIQKRLKRERNFVKSKSLKQSARAKSRWTKEKEECRGNATRGNATSPTPHLTSQKDNTPLSISLPTGSESEAAPDGAPTPNGSGTKRAVSDLKPSRAKTSTRKTKFPERFRPNTETLNACLGRQCDGNRPKFDRLLRQFVDWAKADGARKADWQAACRLYIAEAIRREQDKADQNTKFAATRARMAIEERGKERA